MEETVGVVLRDHLSRLQISQVQAAKTLGYSAKHLNQVLQDKKTVSMDLALAFERLCGAPGLADRVLMMQLRSDLAARRAL